MKRGETFAASFGFGALMQATSFVERLTLAMLADRTLCADAALPRGMVADRRHCRAGAGVRRTAMASIVAIVAVAGFCIIGAQHVLNNFTAGSYETLLRASGVGMELGRRPVSARSSGPYRRSGCCNRRPAGPTAVFWAIGGAAIVGAFAIGSLGLAAAAGPRPSICARAA